MATRSDDIGVYLGQVEQRTAPDDELAAIAAAQPAVAAQLRDRRAATADLLSGSPPLREVDNLAEQWRGLRDQLEGWGKTLTARATALDKELGGLDELRAIWRATADEARVQAAPPAVIDRIKLTLDAVAATRKTVAQRRKQALELQDQVVGELAGTRDPLRALKDYRSKGFDRLLVADTRPVWQTFPSEGVGAAVRSAVAVVREEFGQTREYLAERLPRLLLQATFFAVLGTLLLRARRRIGQVAASDVTMARGARVFDVPFSAAAVLTLVASGTFLPDPPILLADLIGLVALLPMLRVVRRLVDPPVAPALWAIGAFYVVDQASRLLASQPFLEQALFTLERLAAIAFVVWFVRSGRFRAMFTADSRWAATAERAVGLLAAMLAFSAAAGALGFMQLSRYLQEVFVDGAYMAMLLFGLLQILEALWAYLLRTRAARRLHMVADHRALLQRRGEQLLGWLAFVVWVLQSLRNARLLEPLRDGVRAVLDAGLTVGSLHLSLGVVLAFAITIWLSFVVSRGLRFVLAEDVYPRVDLAPGMPYALSSLLHYAVLLVGFFMAVAATGVDMNRFSLLAGAFGVGIGFGLQTIVNNFVSGLILLFERPVKVGDTIQLATVSGEVQHIGIRASVVRTFDGADVIVPNAEFVSGAVTNWTLSDRRRRIDLPVGVAYGSDPERVLALLRGVAANHPLVLEQPGPVAFFMTFGDSALNFELRCWTDHFDKWVATRSDLAIAVNAALTEAGIGIPFPQRDTRITGGEDPLVVRIVRGREGDPA